ncbi:hypothetical protein HDU76_011513 [Blyttiomyces sp. JEL0837]|nr:hypothetical protein HDU76_011513 [Blyttiomyces sp. JEL0837]
MSLRSLPAALGLSVLLTLSPSTTVTAQSPNDHQHHHHQPYVPGHANIWGWSYSGCYIDLLHGVRALESSMPNRPEDETVVGCINICGGWVTVAGVSNGGQCFCGYKLPNQGLAPHDSDCDIPCNGSPDEACGGRNRLSVYTSDRAVEKLRRPEEPERTPPPPPPHIPGWSYLGCYVDETIPRHSLPLRVGTNLTNEQCAITCNILKFTLSGTTNYGECFCGYSVPEHKSPHEDDCDMVCKSDPSQVCGGSGRFTLYGVNAGPRPPRTGKMAYRPSWISPSKLIQEETEELVEGQESDKAGTGEVVGHGGVAADGGFAGFIIDVSTDSAVVYTNVVDENKDTGDYEAVEVGGKDNELRKRG